MTPHDTTRNPRTLQLRRFTTSLDVATLRPHLEEATVAEPALNASFITAAATEGFLVSGFDQLGGILFRIETGELGNTLTLEFRQGDQAAANVFVRRLGKHLRVLKNPPDFNPLAFETMAQLLQMLRRTPGGRIVMIAESAIESALLCHSEEYPAVIEALDFLRTSHKAENWDAHQPLACRPRLRRLRVRHPRPFQALHKGEKFALPHRIHIPCARGESTLRLHFARLPRNRYLIGYADEIREEF